MHPTGQAVRELNVLMLITENHLLASLFFWFSPPPQTPEWRGVAASPVPSVLIHSTQVMWCAVEVLDENDKPLMSVSPSDSLLEAVFNLCCGKVHRLLVVNPITGNALHVLTYLRILRFIHVCVCEQLFLFLSLIIYSNFMMLPAVRVLLILDWNYFTVGHPNYCKPHVGPGQTSLSLIPSLSHFLLYF